LIFQWHLVGHDHGALLGWVAAASAEGAQKLLSYSALSIPHARAFSDGLYGPGADVEQQVASQYFSMFSMNESASLNAGFLYRTLGATSGDAHSDSFASASEFQNSLWWYNGAFAAGYMALPPTFTAEQLLVKYKDPSMSSLRALFPGSAAAQAHPEGIPAAVTVGNVSAPALYVCGETDTAILCSKPYALKTAGFCSGGYQYLQVACGHDVLAKGSADGCKTQSDVDKVNGAILAHIQAADAAAK
jgi:pimeloyl-ACP methyl ester carboxylesterase